MKRILVIQTAFLGDVILATAVLEKLHLHFPEAKLDVLVRHDAASLFKGHPFINEVVVWEKRTKKYRHLAAILKTTRANSYDWVINLHRHGSSGLITVLSGAKRRSGFSANPWSWRFTHKVDHLIDPATGTHEVERNHQLISEWTDAEPGRPKLYPTKAQFDNVAPYKTQPYVCLAPWSVWFTKRWPAEKWEEVLDALEIKAYLLGGPGEKEVLDALANGRSNVKNLAGKLSLVESAALMADARMNAVNDSGPLHLCSAMDAPVMAIFCSTVPGFGFGPLSTNSEVVETKKDLQCRPCGLHGHEQCPLGHFECAHTLDVKRVITRLQTP